MDLNKRGPSSNLRALSICSFGPCLPVEKGRNIAASFFIRK